tara:strand:+ start:743 stop:979 length:237 start_codon:yes stop_codon:yes gene_type:complete
MSALISDDDYFSNDEISELDEMDEQRRREVADFLVAKYGESDTVIIMDYYTDFYKMSVVEVAYTLGHLLDPTNYEQTL